MHQVQNQTKITTGVGYDNNRLSKQRKEQCIIFFQQLQKKT